MKKILNTQKWVMCIIGLLFCISQKAKAQTPTTDLTTHVQVATLPAGTTFEWHNALPIGVANLMTAPQISAAAPGLYYAVYNYGGSPVCYSQPSLIRVITNVCPATTVNLRTAVDSTSKPAGSLVTFHSGYPATGTNRITGTAITAASAGTFYTSYCSYDASTLTYCYSNTSVIVSVTTSCATLTAVNPPAQTATPSQAKTGTGSVDLVPSGGNGTYVYSVDNTASCIVPSGGTALPLTSNLTVTNSSTGAYTYTAPTAVGTYYYCIKVCDTTTPTPNCVTKTYTLTVAPAACIIGTSVPSLK